MEFRCADDGVTVSEQTKDKNMTGCFMKLCSGLLALISIFFSLQITEGT